MYLTRYLDSVTVRRSMIVGLMIIFVIGSCASLVEARHLLLALAGFTVILLTLRDPFPVAGLLLFLLPLHGLIVYRWPELKYWKEALILTGSIGALANWFASLIGGRKVTIRALDWLILLYAVYMSLRIGMDGWSPVTMYAVGTYVLYVLIYPILRVSLAITSRLRSIVAISSAAASLVALGAVLETLFGIKLDSEGVPEATRFGLQRASFSVGSALALGPYMAFATTLTLWLYNWGFGRQRRRPRVILLACSALQFIALFLSGTRAAWLQLLLTGICLFFMARRGSFTWKQVLEFSLLSLVFVSAFAVAPLEFFQDILKRNVGRFQAWITAGQLLARHLLTGIGPGATLWITVPLRDSTFVTESYILQIVLETGIFGGLLFLAVYFGAILLAIQIMDKSSVRNRWSASLCAVVVSNIIGYFPSLLIAQSLNAWVLQAYFWTHIAIISIIATCMQDKDEDTVAISAGSNNGKGVKGYEVCHSRSVPR